MSIGGVTSACGEDICICIDDTQAFDGVRYYDNYVPTLRSQRAGLKVLQGSLPAILKYQRTEYAKQIRRAYEAGEIKERRCNMREWTIRTDGISNTLTTVQKDNLLLEEKEVCCVAMRGRYDENGKISQHLEPRYDGITNTLTTVQKDNMVVEFHTERFNDD